MVQGMSSYVWVGVNDIAVEGLFRWLADGSTEPPDSGNWWHGQPAQGAKADGQDCGYAFGEGYLGDQNCTHLMSFICKGDNITAGEREVRHLEEMTSADN